MSDHLFYHQTCDFGVASAEIYRIDGLMSRTERDIIQDALKAYRDNVSQEKSCSSILARNAKDLVETIEKLIEKFNTMEWE